LVLLGYFEFQANPAGIQPKFSSRGRAISCPNGQKQNRPNRARFAVMRHTHNIKKSRPFRHQKTPANLPLLLSWEIDNAGSE
jgi:hypothetical protein